MVGQRHVAAGQRLDVAAVAAQDEGGRAAPVEEQDRLLAGGQTPRHGAGERAAEDAAIARPQLLAQVHDLHRRQLAAVPTRSDRRRPECPHRRSIAGLCSEISAVSRITRSGSSAGGTRPTGPRSRSPGRRGAAQDDRRAGQLRPSSQGDRAGVVARRALLLVGRLRVPRPAR